MRLLLFVNLIAIVVLAGALARTYEGAPLPWVVQHAPARTASQAAAPALPLRTDETSLPASGTAASVTSPAPAERELRFLTEGAYPPFNARDDAGRLVGFDVDMAREICRRLKRTCRIEARKWAALLPALVGGDADAVIASMVIPSPGRNLPQSDRRVIFTKRYYSTPAHFAARRKSSLVAASAAAIAGKRVAVQRGSSHAAFLAAHFPGAIAVPADTLEEAERALAEGRADYLFADRNALLYWLAGKGGSCCRLVGADYADRTYFGPGAGIALNAKDEALRADIDGALNEIAADGTYAEISRRYFGQSIR